jgi:predicted dinucleotide-binding enzyme
MDIVIIGSGNVAAVLGRKFISAGHRIVQVVGRNAKAASALAYEWDTASTNYLIALNKNAEVYIIAVSDDAIDDVVRELKLPGKVVAHTAASVPKEVLKKATEHYGVFYPLQSLNKDMKTLPDTPIFYDGSDDITKKKLQTLANSISKEKVAEAGDDERLKLHVAASRIKEIAPQQVQTGPALRHDSETIHKHLELLKNHPQLKNIYVLLTESIQQVK